MNPGKLRHRITIQRPRVTQGPLGQASSTTWDTVADRIGANVLELSGRDLLNAQQMQSDITIKIETRWLDGINTRMRVLWHDKEGDRTLAIEVPPLNPDCRKRYMTLMCKQPE